MPPEPALPPEALVRRVGWDLHSKDPADVYEQRGRQQWQLIRALLPADCAQARVRSRAFLASEWSAPRRSSAASRFPSGRRASKAALSGVCTAHDTRPREHAT